MGVKLYIPASMGPMARGREQFEVSGRTVGECLSHLLGLVPPAREVLFYEAGGELHLRSRIAVLVNGEGVDHLAREVKDGDEIRIKLNVQ